VIFITIMVVIFVSTKIGEDAHVGIFDLFVSSS
jgi:hypothetical protein